MFLIFKIVLARANVGHRASATLQIELYRVVDYDRKWSIKFHKDCMLDLFGIFTFNFQNSIRAHVGHAAFATLQIDLYRVVDYDSKWSTKFHKDCILNIFFYFIFKTSFDIYFLNFQK